jgi:hypothetical protein
MSYFLNLFKRKPSCSLCSSPLSFSTSETCDKCRNFSAGRQICPTCCSISKKKGLIFARKQVFCSSCSSLSHRRSHSAGSLRPIELKAPPSNDNVEHDLLFADLSQARILEKLQEKELQPPVPLGSKQQVFFP